MPLASYDYDYYEYVNGRRVNKTDSSSQTANRRTSVATSQVRRTTGIVTQTKRSATGRTQTRKNTTPAVKAKSVSSRKVSTNVKKKQLVRTNTTKRVDTKKAPIQRKKNNIDISIKTSSKIVNKPKEMTLKKPKAKREITLKQAIGRIFGISILFVISLAVCYRYSLIDEKSMEFNSIKKEYEKIQNENEQIEAYIESKKDSTYIENYAKYQLGMQEPSPSQKVYVNIEKKDKILSPVTIEEEANDNLFEKICREVGKILD